MAFYVIFNCQIKFMSILRVCFFAALKMHMMYVTRKPQSLLSKRIIKLIINEQVPRIKTSRAWGENLKLPPPLPFRSIKWKSAVNFYFCILNPIHLLVYKLDTGYVLNQSHNSRDKSSTLERRVQIDRTNGKGLPLSNSNTCIRQILHMTFLYSSGWIQKVD